MSLTVTRMQINFLPSRFHGIVFPTTLDDQSRTTGPSSVDFILINSTAADQWWLSFLHSAGYTLHYLWLKQSRVAYSAKLRFNVYSGEGLQYGSALAPLIAYWRRKTFDFLATSSRLPASKVSFSSFMDVLLRVGKARWMTAALFGPVGSDTNNPIMLPGEMQKAACQEHSAV